MQGAVLGLGAQRGQRAGGDAGPARGVVHLLTQVGHRRCLQTHYPSVSDMLRATRQVSASSRWASVDSYGGAGLRSGQCQRRPHVHRRCPAAARPDRSRLFAVVVPRAERAATRRWPPLAQAPRCSSSPHSAPTPRPNSCAPICATTRSGSTAWSACRGPAARRRSSSTPQRRTPSWSRRARTRI